MKKVAAVFAMVVLTLGMVSCDAEANVQDDQAYDVQACAECETKTETGRD
ncbi:hypothetical protein [Cellulophaga sp. Hel_I_12]|nr:hypothetical protein [Cellulophaga sp. Hel_I_12]